MEIHIMDKRLSVISEFWYVMYVENNSNDYAVYKGQTTSGHETGTINKCPGPFTKDPSITFYVILLMNKQINKIALRATLDKIGHTTY